MKKSYLSVTIVALAILFLSVTYNFDRIVDGIRVGTPKKIIYANEIKTLSGIDTTKTIAEQFAEKTDNADFIEGNTLLYTKSQVNALVSRAKKSELLKALQDQGSTVKVLPAGASSLFYGSLAMVDARPYQCTYIIEDTLSITGVGYEMITAGVFNAGSGGTTDYNGFFLTRVSGANYTVVAVTANDTTLWDKTSGAYSTKVFEGNPITLYPGVYKLYGVFNTRNTPSVIPAFATCQGIGNNSYHSLLTNNHKMEGQLATTLVVPSLGAVIASTDVTGNLTLPSFVLY